jgi:hypothetical protein
MAATSIPCNGADGSSRSGDRHGAPRIAIMAADEPMSLNLYDKFMLVTFITGPMPFMTKIGCDDLWRSAASL